MYLFVKKLIFFCCFLLISYSLFLLVYGRIVPVKLQKNLSLLNPKRSDFLYNRINEIKNYHNLDVLFIGSSHTCRGFDTRIFSSYGFYTFNLGSSSQTPVQSETLLKNYIKSLKPKIVVLDVFPLVFESDGVEADLNFILNLSTYNSIFMVRNYRDIKVINTFIYQAIAGTLRNNFIKSKLSANGNDDKYIKGGFIETHRKYKNKYVSYMSNIWNPRYRQTKALDEIVAFLREKNIKLILVQAPVNKKFYNSLKNNDQVDAFFSSKAIYYNFNKMITLNDTANFFDSHHLNQSGVEIFDRAFIKNCLQTVK